MIKYFDEIKKCPLFQGIDEEDIKKILVCLEYRIAEYQKNDYAILADDIVDDVGVVLKGKVSIVKDNFNGNSTRVNIFHTGDMFGEAISICRVKNWPTSVQALTDCAILYIRPNKILDFCDNICSHHRVLLTNFVRVVAKKALMINRKVEFLSIKSITGKLSKYILEQSVASGKTTFTMPLNREELADFLNVSRPSMSRELCKIRDMGIIDFYRETIRIIDVNRLKELLEQ